jgi:hypothetical protein
MLQAMLREGRIDRLAVSLSGLCLAHCVATAVIIAMLASASSIFMSPIVHEVGLTLAIVLGALALGHGALVHGFMMPAAIGSLGLGVMAGAMNLGHGSEEILFTMLGVAILALGHDLNYRAGR